MSHWSMDLKILGNFLETCENASLTSGFHDCQFVLRFAEAGDWEGPYLLFVLLFFILIPPLNIT